MSLSDYKRSNSVLSQEDILKRSPSNIEEAMGCITSYISSQLPLVVDMDFIPICFDITADQTKLVIGGQYGNLAIFDLHSKKMTKDIELISKSITSVNLALDDTIVIAATENCSLFFLEFPSFYLRHSLNLSGLRLITKVPLPGNKIYVSDYSSKIKIFSVENYTEEFLDCTLNVLQFDICTDGNLIVYALEDGSIKLFHTTTQSLLQGVNENSSLVEILKFSENIRFIAAGFKDFTIKVWNVDAKMTLKNVFSEHTGCIRGLAFVSNNRYLVSGGVDKKIIMFDMKFESLPYYFELFDSEVVWFKTSANCEKLYFSQDMNKLMIWEIPKLSKNVRYKKHSGKVNKVLFIPGTFDILSLGEDGLAIQWDYQNDMLQDSIKIEGNLITGIVSSTAQFAFISSNRPSLIRLNLGTYKYYDYDINSSARSMRFSSDENLLAIGDELFRIIIFDSVIMERKYIIKGHTDIVTEIYFLESDSLVITSSMDGRLMKWDNATSNKVSTYEGHSAPVTCLVITKNEEWAVSGSQDNEVIIWSISKEIVLHKILQGPSKIGLISLFLSADKSYLIALQDNMASYWEMDTLSLIFQFSTCFSAGSLAVTQSEEMIAIGEGNTIYIEENPLRSNTIKIVGRSYGSSHKYMNFVREIIAKPYRIKHLDTYNHWMFTPYRLGISHILAFINKETNLSAALLESDNRGSFCTTITGENPLSISVNLNHKACIETCLKYLKIEFSRNNTRVYSHLANCLTNLTSLDISSIPKLYDTLFQQNKSLHLPHFCIAEKVSLPSLCHSKNFLINVEKLLNKESVSSHGESIIFFNSLCPLYIEIGTAGSINFLQSLLNCRYPEVFRSQLLKVILKDKWERVNWANYAQGLLYIIYLVQLSVFCIFFRDSGEFLIELFVIHMLLFLYEILQIITDFYDYWRDMWNILDQLRGFSFSLFAYLEWQGIYDKNVLLTVIIFSWTRGISYFRMFEGTRYMVRLLSEVISDMQVFFIILTYSTMAFTFILYLNNTDTSFTEYLTIAYRLNLSDFETNYNQSFDWIIFFFATVINPLIMLNLLVSIMANTYKRVKEGNDIANFQELTEMILEVEKLMFWKRGNKQQYYIQQCVSLTSVEDNEGDKALERLKTMRDQIQKIEKSVHYVSSNIQEKPLIELKSNLKIINSRENTYKEILVKNKKLLKSCNGLMRKLAIKLEIFE